MWYWKTQYNISRLYFSRAIQACQDLQDKFVNSPNNFTPNEIPNAVLTNIPSYEGENYIKAGVELRNGKILPAIQLFPTEPSLTETFNSIAAEFENYNKVKPTHFKSQQQFTNKFCYKKEDK